MESSSIANTKINKERDSSVIDKFAKEFVLRVLKSLSIGHLTIEDSGTTHSFGEPLDSAELIAHIKVNDQTFYRDIFLNRSIGAGEGYMRNSWSSPDLLKFIQLMSRNLLVINQLDQKRPLINRLAIKLMHLLNANTLKGSRKNISAHYDLGNDFFELFLDPTMMYSSAIFPSKDASLYEASVHKLETICQKIELSPEDRLLEIGTGWGGLAIYAAKHYGCKVTTTTISREQYEYAKQRVEVENLSDKVTLLLEDYRDLEVKESGQFDKLVSVEMIEAVGHENYDKYFEQCDKLLKPDGLMLIQAITIADQRYLSAKYSVDFIQRYIFPGGSLPSVEVMASCTSKKTAMQIVDIQDISEHYADTLLHWREAFLKNIEQVREQGFDDVFCRMWEFYLVYCEGGFRERVISTVQVVMAKPDYRFT